MPATTSSTALPSSEATFAGEELVIAKGAPWPSPQSIGVPCCARSSAHLRKGTWSSARQLLSDLSRLKECDELERLQSETNQC